MGFFPDDYKRESDAAPGGKSEPNPKYFEFNK